jgi:cellobiose PTS system EIIA component
VIELEKLNMEEVIFGIINYGGNAKGLAYEALEAAENGDFDTSDRLMKEADRELLEAHHIQTDLIQKEAAGEQNEVSILLVHAQDHLMTAIEAKSLIEAIIRLYKRLSEK